MITYDHLCCCVVEAVTRCCTSQPREDSKASRVPIQIPSRSEVRWRLGVAPGGLPAAGGSACDPCGRDAGIRGHSQGAWENHRETLGKNHRKHGKPGPPKSTKYVQVWDVGWVFLFSYCQRSFEETVPTATIWQLVWGAKFHYLSRFHACFRQT